MDEGRRFFTVDDYEPVARELLPRDAYDYYAGGAGDEWTLRENRSAFERWVFRPRVLRTTRARDLSVEVLGQRLSFPVLVAPWAYQKMAHPDGELATARACGRAGTIMVVSTTTESYLEEVASTGTGPKWWQLYVSTDRGRTQDMLHRVHAASYTAVMMTVDFQENGLRHRDSRSGFVMPMGLPGSELEYEPELSWEDLAWVREHAPVPLLLKGILTREDAKLALDAGIDGIVVSNHGGRQLDGAPAAIAVLPEIVAAVDGRVPVMVDGGFRRGTDVMKALALGAAAVMVARPVIWGLVVAGEDGVVDVLGILRRELDNAMALTGCNSLADVTPGLIAPAV